MCASGTAAITDGAETGPEPSEGWREERDALSAIYGDGAAFPSDSQTTLLLELPAEAASLLAGPQVGLFWGVVVVG